MEFNVNITCDSDAFDPDGDGMATAEEITRILSVVKSKLMDGDREGTLRDYNGNTVGSFSLSQQDAAGGSWCRPAPTATATNTREESRMTSMDTQQQDTSYNGWTNYPTWCVNLWLSNDEGLYNEALDMSRETVAGDHPTSPYWTVEESRKLNLADRIEECINEGLLPDLDGFPSDLMRWALGQVNWHEIADSWIETAADQ